MDSYGCPPPLPPLEIADQVQNDMMGDVWHGWNMDWGLDSSLHFCKILFRKPTIAESR